MIIFKIVYKLAGHAVRGDLWMPKFLQGRKKMEQNKEEMQLGWLVGLGAFVG